MGKVERVDFLLVAFERIPDALAGNIPYLKYAFQSRGTTGGDGSAPNEPIPVAGRKELAIRGETDGADVEVSLLGIVVVVERAAERAGARIEYLGGAVAPGREPTYRRTQHTTVLWLNWCMRLTLSDWVTRGL